MRQQTENVLALPAPRRRGEIPSGRSVSEVAAAARMMTHIFALEREMAREVGTLREALARVEQRPQPQAQPTRRPRSSADILLKLSIAKYKAMGITGRGLAVGADRDGRTGRVSWIKKTGLRSLVDLYDAKTFGFPKTQHTVRKFFGDVDPYSPHQPKARTARVKSKRLGDGSTSVARVGTA